MSFILSSISSGLEFWSANHTSIYKNSELKVFKNVFGWNNDLSGTNAYNADSCILLEITVDNITTD